jgi:hypothetical protein
MNTFAKRTHFKNQMNSLLYFFHEVIHEKGPAG